MLLLDPPTAWTTKTEAKSGVTNIGTTSKNAALFFPRLKQPNPLHDNQVELRPQRRHRWYLRAHRRSEASGKHLRVSMPL